MVESALAQLIFTFAEAAPSSLVTAVRSADRMNRAQPPSAAVPRCSIAVERVIGIEVRERLMQNFPQHRIAAPRPRAPSVHGSNAVSSLLRNNPLRA
jgi:hypothetical protein